MVSVTAEYALCERCGQEQGLRHTNCDTNESSFVCGACGWSWEIAIHRFGADELKRLAVLLAQNPMAWGEVDQVLDVLVRSCEQRCPATEVAEILQRVRQMPLSERGGSEEACLQEIVRTYPRGLWAIENGKPVFMQSEGRDKR